MSGSVNGGEIQTRENLVSDGLIASESDSQVKENETQERVSESAGEVRVNEHNIQASELTMSDIYVRAQEKSGVTEFQESAKVTLWGKWGSWDDSRTERSTTLLTWGELFRQ